MYTYVCIASFFPQVVQRRGWMNTVHDALSFHFPAACDMLHSLCSRSFLQCSLSISSAASLYFFCPVTRVSLCNARNEYVVPYHPVIVLNSVGPTLTVGQKNVFYTFKISFHFLTIVFCVTLLYKNNETLEMRKRNCSCKMRENAYLVLRFSTKRFPHLHFRRLIFPVFAFSV